MVRNCFCCPSTVFSRLATTCLGRRRTSFWRTPAPGKAGAMLNPQSVKTPQKWDLTAPGEAILVLPGGGSPTKTGHPPTKTGHPPEFINQGVYQSEVPIFAPADGPMNRASGWFDRARQHGLLAAAASRSGERRVSIDCDPQATEIQGFQGLRSSMAVV